MQGYSLDDTRHVHVCMPCWEKVPLVDKLEAVRRWTLDKQSKDTLDAIAQLCRGACDGWHIPGIGGAGRN